ncbi:MAG: S1 RNA-binding domain-containing protein, partial [Desulfatirhabdiaceae bacterium]
MEEHNQTDQEQPDQTAEAIALVQTDLNLEDQNLEISQTAEDAVFDDTMESGDTMDNLMEMYEESFKRFAEGEVVTGRIISVDRDFVLVDIGYKSEGQIRINEFRDETGNVSAKSGDPVEVMVEWWDDENEVVILSKEKAAKVKVWEEIKKIHENDGIIQGIILARVKGGFSVDVGVQAFLPGSQADLRPIRNLDEMVGKTFEFKILKYNRKR